MFAHSFFISLIGALSQHRTCGWSGCWHDGRRSPSSHVCVSALAAVQSPVVAWLYALVALGVAQQRGLVLPPSLQQHWAAGESEERERESRRGLGCLNRPSASHSLPSTSTDATRPWMHIDSHWRS